MPPVLFGADWKALKLEHLQAFIDDASDEGVTWEAKADDDEQRARAAGQEPGRLGKHTIRKAVCGLANQIGGYVIIGARRIKATDPWTVPGVTWPDVREPDSWLREVIADHGVAPVPWHDVKTWHLPGGAVVAVIAVDPVAEPPCMTSQGIVYERVSGKTVKVSDPAVLARLFERGRAANRNAEANADHAARHVMKATKLDHPHRTARISLALAAVNYRADIASRLFTQSTRQAILDGLGPPLHVEAAVEKRVRMRQSYVHGYATEPYRRAVIFAHWTGAVAVHSGLTHDPLDTLSPIDEIIAPAWSLASQLVARLGGYGTARLTLITNKHIPPVVNKSRLSLPATPIAAPPRGSLFDKLPQMTTLRRPVELGDPDAVDLASIQRELQRAAGIETFETEPGEA